MAKTEISFPLWIISYGSKVMNRVFWSQVNVQQLNWLATSRFDHRRSPSKFKKRNFDFFCSVSIFEVQRPVMLVTVMLVISWCWWHRDWWLKVGNDFRMSVTEFRCWWYILNVGAGRQCKKTVDAGDPNGHNRHKHLKVVTKTFRLQHPSPTSM